MKNQLTIKLYLDINQNGVVSCYTDDGAKQDVAGRCIYALVRDALEYGNIPPEGLKKLSKKLKKCVTEIEREIYRCEEEGI